MAGRRCRTCTHPDRDRIELEAAIAWKDRARGSIAEVGMRYGIPKSSIYRHVENHMTQEQFARLLHGVPDSVEIDVDKVTREQGQRAILGMARLVRELQEVAARADQAGEIDAATRARVAQGNIYREQAKLAGKYPGMKSTTTNNVLVADGRQVFDVVARILSKARDLPDARRMLAHELASGAQQQVIDVEVIEHDRQE